MTVPHCPIVTIVICRGNQRCPIVPDDVDRGIEQSTPRLKKAVKQLESRLTNP